VRVTKYERSTLLHQAFVYGSRDEFVATMAPFIREGLERDEAVFAATTRQNVDGLREELGRDADAAELQDTTEWKIRPYERLQAFKQMVRELPPGRALRAMGDPVWEGSDAVLRQWARYESVINLALADAPMRFICLYDGSSLPDRILDYAGRTHPQRVESDGVSSSDEFIAPDEFVPGHPATPPVGSADLPIGGAAFRRALEQHALAAGLAQQAAQEFVLAANEVTTNALVHGVQPIRARVWVQDGELVCQVRDAGPGIADPLAGWLPPASGTQGGWGLPIARQLADAVEIARDGGGLAVSVHRSIR
jgi:anti-sigma regulatory factor (Ser/Thr protein kinase)